MERPNPENYMLPEAREQWRADLAAYYQALDQALDQTRNQQARPQQRRGQSIEVGIPLAVSSGKLP